MRSSIVLVALLGCATADSSGRAPQPAPPPRCGSSSNGVTYQHGYVCDEVVKAFQDAGCEVGGIGQVACVDIIGDRGTLCSAGVNACLDLVSGIPARVKMFGDQLATCQGAIDGCSELVTDE